MIANVKKAIGNITGTSIGNDADDPYPNIFVEGIVQGDIKFNAINDWKTTLYYGFTDSLKGAKVGGVLTRSSVNGSSVIKFANTLMNTMGYTLGGTGPASRKMYNGSNLNGFSVQFKWYTPYMEGWREAIQSLCVLGWPMSAYNQGNTGVNTKIEPTESEKLAIEAEYKNIIANCAQHIRAIANMRVKIEQMKELDDNDSEETLKIYNEYFKGKKFQYTDLNEIALMVDSYIRIGASLSTPLSDLESSLKIDNLVMAAAKNRDALQLRSNSIGSDINAVHWYDNTAIPVDEKLTKIEGDKTTSTPSKTVEQPSSSKGVNLFDAFGNVKDAAISLFKGLADSFARNPPIVKLEIFDHTNSRKYLFSPLVISGFSINASRETIEGDPVLLTIDITFDYYQVNATNAIQAPNQTFAGVPLFKLEEV